jgi:hypothetical protein
LEKEEIIERESGMPDFVKSLRDIKEFSGAIFHVFDGGVSPPEAELERGY